MVLSEPTGGNFEKAPVTTITAPTILRTVGHVIGARVKGETQ
jgi:hypothetical protein